MVFRADVDAFFDPAPYRISGPTVTVGPDSAVAIAHRTVGEGRLSRLDVPHAESGPTVPFIIAQFVKRRLGGRLRRSAQWHVLALVPRLDADTVGLRSPHGVAVARCWQKRRRRDRRRTLPHRRIGLLVWPGWRDIRFGSHSKRGASVTRASYDVHKIAGIVVVGFLLLSAASGVMLTFKAATRTLLGVAPLPLAPRHNPVSVSSPSLRSSLRRARVPQSDACSISFPARSGRPVVMERRGGDDLDQIKGNKRLYLDPSRAPCRRVDGMRDPIAGWSGLVYPSMSVKCDRIRCR